MTDEKPVLIARFFYVILKYVFGFPVSLINNEYPFFLTVLKCLLMAFC